MTDYHSHILPGMDDGSRSVEEMVDHALGKALMQFGITPSGFRSWHGGDSISQENNL